MRTQDVPKGFYTDRIMKPGEMTITPRKHGLPTVLKFNVDRCVEGKWEKQINQKHTNITWPVEIKVEQQTRKGIRSMYLFAKNCKGQTSLRQCQAAIGDIVDQLQEIQKAIGTCIREAQTLTEREKENKNVD